MKIHVYLLLLLLSAHTARAQESLCLAKGATPGSIDFRPDVVNSYLRLDRYKVVLFGELHNETFNPELEYHLITDLNRHYGFRHLFLERSVSAAWHFNEYLRTGDTVLFRMPYEQWRVFWKRLYDYNAALPDSSKLVIHGVDFETTGVFSTLRELAPAGRPVPPSLKPVMDTVAAHLADSPLSMYRIMDGKMVEYDNTAFTRTLRYIQGQLKAHAEDAALYFGAHYPVVRDIAANDAPVVVMPKPRNKTMFRAMSRIVADQHVDRFIGIFGGQHTFYTVPSSISNAVGRLPGFESNEVLNIVEVVYNLPWHGIGKPVPIDDEDKIKALNGGCKATLLKAASVPGYGRKADVVIIGDGNP